MLKRSVNCPKGFHRRALALNSIFLDKEGVGTKLNQLEKTQLYAEVCVLNALTKNNSSRYRHAMETEREKGKLKKRETVDSLTQKNLLTYCWGVGKNQFTRVKKEIRTKGIDNGLSFDAASVLMVPVSIKWIALLLDRMKDHLITPNFL